MKKISVLGSTGSIGTQTLDVVRKNNDIEVVAMAAGRRIKEMEAQIREFRPKLVSVADEQLAKVLSEKFGKENVKIVWDVKKD